VASREVIPMANPYIDPSEQARLRAEVEADIARSGRQPMTREELEALGRSNLFESEEELEDFLAVIYEARYRCCVTHFTDDGARSTLVPMSGQPTPEPIEIPPVTAEERAEWDAIKAKVLAGDVSDLVPWDELAAELEL